MQNNELDNYDSYPKVLVKELQKLNPGVEIKYNNGDIPTFWSSVPLEKLILPQNCHVRDDDSISVEVAPQHYFGYSVGVIGKEYIPFTLGTTEPEREM